MMSDVRQPDETAVLLVIGPSQTGKSTFINKLRSLSATRAEPEAAEGRCTFSCTTTCTIYNLDLPLSGWDLVDSKTGNLVEIPDDEESLFTNVWQKSKDKRMRIVEEDSSGSRLHLKLIDTPGLGDSHGKDNEHVFSVLSFLNRLSVTDQPYLTGVVFVCSMKLGFTTTFQEEFKYYERCMPNLFGGLIVVNTNFTVVEWATRHELSIANLKRSMRNRLHLETAKEKAIRDRVVAFQKDFGRRPLHFFVDSKPNPKYAFEEYNTRQNICAFLNAVDSKSRMPIKQMHLIKRSNALAIDERLAGMLRQLESRWETERKELLATESQEVQYSAHLEKCIEAGEREVQVMIEKLKEKDNDTEFALHTYTPQDDISIPQRGFNWVVRLKIEGSLKIEESVTFMVRAPNESRHARWTAEQQTGQSWQGTYSADPGYLPRLTAKSYTFNCHWYTEEIKFLKGSIDRRRSEIAKHREEMSRHRRDKEEAKNPRIAALSSLLTRAKIIGEDLRSEEVPLSLGFDDAARERYRLSPNQIGGMHLFMMVRARHTDLAEAIRVALQLR